MRGTGGIRANSHLASRRVTHDLSLRHLVRRAPLSTGGVLKASNLMLHPIWEGESASRRRSVGPAGRADSSERDRAAKRVRVKVGSPVARHVSPARLRRRSAPLQRSETMDGGRTSCCCPHLGHHHHCRHQARNIRCSPPKGVEAKRVHWLASQRSDDKDAFTYGAMLLGRVRLVAFNPDAT
jgi:hypothetical protein